jgi:hypothetical protein
VIYYDQAEHSLSIPYGGMPKKEHNLIDLEWYKDTLSGREAIDGKRFR